MAPKGAEMKNQGAKERLIACIEQPTRRKNDNGTSK